MTQPSSKDIVPCPFCGGKLVDTEEGSTFRWMVACCAECGAQGPEVRVQTLGDGSPKQWNEQGCIDALAEWNKRHAHEPPAVPDEREDPCHPAFIAPLQSPMDTSDASPITHMEIISAVAHHAREIAKLTEAVPVECSPQQAFVGAMNVAPIARIENHRRRNIADAAVRARSARWRT